MFRQSMRAWWVNLAIAGLAVVAMVVPASAQVAVEVVEDSGAEIVLEYRLEGVDSQTVWIDGERYERLRIPGEPVTYEAGAPELPYVHRSVIVPDTAAMRVEVLSARYRERLAAIAPSKGLISRKVDPATVPLRFGDAYQRDAMQPGPLAALGQPYVLRDHRGVVVQLRPFQYNPVTGVLRTYTELRVRLSASGTSDVNVPSRPAPRRPSRAFASLYGAHFLNSDHRSSAPADSSHTIDEEGEMLIIVHDPWQDELDDFVAHKEGAGIPVEVVPVSDIGNDAGSIADYIQDTYDSRDLAYVLLVGDAAEVAPPEASGGAADPTYAKVDGSDDYPDLLVGRMSAGTVEELRTQLERTIDYENAPATEQDWYWRGTGIASSEGAGQGDEGQSDKEHMAEIRDWLLDAGYNEVDEIYDPGATDDDVTDAINAGRGIVNYTGHGSPTSWGTTGFNNDDVDALVNDDELPFIVSVACNNGEFDSYGSCFAETWLRATNSGTGAATGAVAMYASSISQSWAPPMEGQDEFNLLLTDPEGPYQTFGGLAFGGSCSMIDDYGADGVEMFDTWILFGDPSLRVVGAVDPPSGLKVTPKEAFESEGPAAGPLNPSSKTYTLENLGDAPFDWEARASQPWVGVEPGAGTLTADESVDVVVSLNDAARNLDNGDHAAEVSFVNLTDHEGDTARDVWLSVGRVLTADSWAFEQDPGWSGEGEWEFGSPQGRGGSGPLHADPTSGATGDNVYGANLAGDIQPIVGGPHRLTSEAVDLSAFETVELSFQRWLNQVGLPYGTVSVGVSADDGASWTEIWNSGTEQGIADGSWTPQSFELSQELAGAERARIRWSYSVEEPVPYAGTGWNVDDVEFSGSTESESVQLSVTADRLSWSDVPGAIGYDVVRGDVGSLIDGAGDFAAATEECLADDVESRELSYGAAPQEGEAFWILVRGVAAEGALTYQSLAPSQVGVRDDGIDAAGASCN